MPDWLEPIVRWFYSDANGAALARFLSIAAPVGLVIGFFIKTFKRQEITLIHKSEAKPEGFNEAQLALRPEEPILTLTLDQYETRLKTREDELRAELSQAHADEKALLQAQIDELTRQQNHPEEAFKAFKTRIAELEALLGNAETEDEQAAKDALEAGDLIKADEIFARISAAQNLSIKKAADAEYARGEIAEQQIRWKDAATHFAEAARLDPIYRNLFQAHEYALKSGNYPAAQVHGTDLIKAASIEHGEQSNERAVALDRWATTLQAKGKYEESELLFREALEITQLTLGKSHLDYSARLNNLAELLRTTGRYDEAEPFSRQALEISEEELGKAHPDYATGLNNLALILQSTGRYDEAEPLYREAMDIKRIAYGKQHPDYARSLNNLAVFLQTIGRRNEAEPLYREAMRITGDTIGKRHPAYATRLNNLAGLLQITGCFEEAEPLFRQAIDIFEKSLGPDHPNTKTVKRNLQHLLDDRGKSDD